MRARATDVEGVWLGLVAGDGSVVWGDAVANPDFGAEREDVIADLADAVAHLSATDSAALRDFDDIANFAGELCATSPGRFALESCFLQLLAAEQMVPVPSLLAPLVQAAAPGGIDVAALVAGAEDGRRAFAAGYRTLKYKVGIETVDKDIATVHALRDIAPSETLKLRFDAGRRYSGDEAERFLREAVLAEPEFVEEPCELLEDRHTLGVPLAFDESAVTHEGFRAALAAGRHQVAVIKPMFVGGLRSALQRSQRCRDAGIEVVITHAMDSFRGRRMAAAAAVVVGGRYAHGIGPALLGADQQPVDSTRFRADADIAPDVESHRPATALEGRTQEAEELATVRFANPVSSYANARPGHTFAEYGGGQPADTGSDLNRRAAAVQSFVQGTAPPVTRVGVRPTNDSSGTATICGLIRYGATAALLSPEDPTALVCDKVQRAGCDATLTCGADRPLALASLRAGVPHFALSESALTRRSGTPGAEYAAATLADSDAMCVVFTSGSTGAPTPVTLTWAQWLANTIGAVARLGVLPGDSHYSALPVYHVGGLACLIRALTLQHTLRLRARFDAGELSNLIAGGSVSGASLVPAMLSNLLDAHDRPWGGLRYLLVGGGACDDKLRARAEESKAPVALTWGMTETCSQAATAFAGSIAREPGAVGAPLPLVAVDTRGGRLRISGPSAGGVHLSNDVGHVSDGTVHVAGRADSAIIVGGRNIDPVEIERTLESALAGARVVVASIPHASLGAVPVLLAEIDPTADLECAALESAVRDMLAPYQQPRSIFIVDQIPRTSLGKPARADARRLAEELCAATPTAGSSNTRCI